MKLTLSLVLLLILACFIGIYSLVIFWPQDNNSSNTKVNIPKGATLGEITDILKTDSIITNDRMFMIAATLMGHSKNIPAGVFSLDNPGSNWSIIRQLTNNSANIKKVTLLEGWTIADVVSQLASKLNISENRLFTLCTDIQFAKKLNLHGSSLEGFLFPDTYYFFEGEDPEQVLTTLVNHVHEFFTDSLKQRAMELGLSEFELITLASIIEGEAMYDSERPIISAVYHNRLAMNMRLQADPTIQYIIEDGPRRLWRRDLKIESPYNTYLNKGLPPGPINNPGRASIMAALYPAENDYLYFVAKGDGYHFFSKTQEEHNQAKIRFKKQR
jgi:UPF0755 protein